MNQTTHGAFHWNELRTWDAKAAQDFYGKALGWSFQSMPMPGGTYTLIVSDGQMVGGMVDLNDMPGCDGMPPHWFAFIAVDDVDARIAKAVENGATVTMPAWDVAGIGRIAMLQDPTGAHIGWMTPAPAA